MILSFAWTTEAFLQGKKTVTRRFYGERQVRVWQAQWDKGNRTHKAYDKDVRAKGQHIFVIGFVGVEMLLEAGSASPWGPTNVFRVTRWEIRIRR